MQQRKGRRDKTSISGYSWLRFVFGLRALVWQHRTELLIGGRRLVD
jgi:hypothetical protein